MEGPLRLGIAPFQPRPPMPAPTTAAELVELIRKSGLIEPARLSAHLAAHPWADRPPAAVCARLVAAGLLTAFHTEQLLRGKYRGFFLGRWPSCRCSWSGSGWARRPCTAAGSSVTS